ncbi:1-acyl-sn-glycerol-3-phosphate acyltransferase [Mycolicibacterium goodii]|uniref:1-acyl-sn-glycerol-3-phosphate acyltransferase n=1 Tax=Mycolicibacterium goodii TaxID=134601 RepID=UPI000C26AC5C|nr:1-acyl-sn-glycerol-3-phosphate acyltransferase [Mycolicibacterium goodii]PJK22041.1 acyltransferase [Mycolicibacterium goodii]
MTRLRRAVTVPLVTVLMVGVLLYGVPLLALAVAADLVLRSTRPSRTVAAVVAFAAMELYALAKLLRGGLDGDRFTRELVGKIYTASRRILDVEVLLDTGSTDPDEVPRADPVIVLSRHCGPGDSLLVAWLLTFHYRLRTRIVLKGLLRCEPVLDLAGDLGCLCFLDRGGKRARAQIRELAASLEGGDALLLFPEGGNFTWARWHEAIRRRRSSGRLREARRAWRQSYTLPPRTGGAAAAMAGAPRANVLVLTHSGFSADGRARPWWRLPVHRRLVVHVSLVRAEELPPRAELGAWLQDVWSKVDAWVADHIAEGTPTRVLPHAHNEPQGSYL